MSGLDLPKDYLSFSALSLWQRDPDTFRRRYYEGEPYITTPYTKFGNKVGDALETGNFFDQTLEKVPRLSSPEHKIEVSIAGVPFLMYLDSYEPDDYSILEYKTGILGRDGRKPWDRVKVRKHIQLPIYTLGVKLKYGDYNPNIKLIWMETKWSTIDEELKFQNKVFKERCKGLKLTGHIETFDRTIQAWELDRMEELIRTTAENISQDYKRWKKTGTT